MFHFLTCVVKYYADNKYYMVLLQKTYAESPEKAVTSQHKTVTCWKNSDGRFGSIVICLTDNDMKRLCGRFCVALCYFPIQIHSNL